MHQVCLRLRAPSLSTYDFSTLHTTLPHNLITEQFNKLIEWTLIGKVPSILHVTEEMLISLPKSIEIIPYGLVRKCVKLSLFYLTIFV